jgi:hypothetical protein
MYTCATLSNTAVLSTAAHTTLTLLVLTAHAKLYSTAATATTTTAATATATSLCTHTSRHDLEGIEHNMAAFQVGRQTRGLLSNQSDTAKYTFMVQRLTYIEKVEQCEFVLLLNKTGNIIVFPNNPARVGEAGYVDYYY